MDALTSDDREKEEAFFREWSTIQLQEYIADSGGTQNPFATRQQLVAEAARISRQAERQACSQAVLLAHLQSSAPTRTLTAQTRPGFEAQRPQTPQWGAPASGTVMGTAVGRMGQPQGAPVMSQPVPSYVPQGQQPQPAPFRPSGRRRALICACNYTGSRNALQGCINDAHCMRYLLMTRMGFGDEDIQMLTDDLPYPAGWPTRNNMLYQMQRLVDSCMPGDSLVLHFSGHGSQVPDYTNDEPNGERETICPCDFAQAGMITNDELNRVLVNRLPHGVRLHCIIDACHSGSALDLEFRCKMKYDGPKWRLHYRQQPRYYKGTAGGQCIQFGACRDSQTAADTTMLSGHTSTGAATFMFISAIEQFGPRVSYANLLGSMTRHLEEMSPHQKMHLGQSFGGTFGSLGRWLDSAEDSMSSAQTPVMSCNQPFDMNMTLQIAL